MPRISCITPSFNKPQYVLDAVESVRNQTFKDWDYLIIENSKTRDIVNILNKSINDPRITIDERVFSEDFRKQYYVPAFILNTYFDRMKGDILMYLSDDDYFQPTAFEQVNLFFATHPEASVCYIGMDSVRGSKQNGWGSAGKIEGKIFYQKGSNLDCAMDGGQVAFRKSALSNLAKPYFETDWKNASHCDGLFITKLCEQFDFNPIDKQLLVHRTTEVSTHNV